MIIVKLIGGLGNQMFQYAAGKSLAYNHNVDLCLDLSYLLKEANGAYTQRHFELDVFNINAKIATDAEIKSFNIEKSGKISRELQRRFPFLFSYVYAAESGQDYLPGFSSFPKNTYLEGFWQSEKYFSSIKNILLQDFKLKLSLNTENENWLNLIECNNSVSIHVRRGDYVLNNNIHGHAVCDLNYYDRALQYIRKNVAIEKIFVFSDDLEWCKDNLKLQNETYFVDSNSRNNSHVDMYLMSKCKHNIIANSSFSWWSAWLNENPEKIVVAPKKWFNDDSLSTQDLIPNKWKTL